MLSNSFRFTTAIRLLTLISLALSSGCIHPFCDHDDAHLTVSSTDPADGASNVPINTRVTATFSAEIDASSVTGETFALTSPDESTVPAAVSLVASNIATLSPLSNLAPLTTYTATLHRVKDITGEKLHGRYVWSFTTGAALESIAPTVVSTLPAAFAVAIPVNQKITATFSEAMLPATINAASFRLTGPAATPITGTVTYVAGSATATFAPSANLALNTTYTATLTTNAKDLAGNPLAADFTWTFTTGATADSAAPTVISTIPADAATGVAINATIVATFSESMDPATLTTATFIVVQGNTPISGAVTYAGAIATFTPVGNLPTSASFTATVTAAATDLAGNALTADFAWSFTTGATADSTAPTVISTIPANAAIGVAINTTIVATFSESMDPATLTSTSFTVSQGSAPIAGAVTYAGANATFTPNSDLPANAAFTATVTTTAADLAGNPLAADFVWTFNTGATADSTAPTVISTIPADAETDVAINDTIVATFSESMDPATLTNTSFTVSQGSTPIAGTVTYAGANATFTPNANLPANAAFTATVTTTAADLAGNPLSADFVWTFNTGATADSTAPTVISTIPADAETDVAINDTIVATFSESMDPATLTNTSFTVSQGSTPIAGTVTYAGANATFTPNANLPANAAFTATVTTTAADLAGNPLAADFVWTFNTGATADSTAPAVISTLPIDGAINVAIDARLIANFSEPMDPATLTNITFTVVHGITPVSGVVTYTGSAATFTPTTNLLANTIFTATISTAATDLAGNPLAADFDWTFTTGAQEAQQVAPLGSANGFAVLAGATVTNAGPTILNGDLGVSPGTAVTGFPPGTVNGAIHAGDSPAAQAKLDLTIAYNDAAGRTDQPITVAGNLGGQTLTPGLYKSISSLEISSGDLTLDAQGDSSGVFILQIASTLTTTAGRQVILSGGANANNIYWQVGTSATLGTNSVFKGNILADQSITLTTGAVLDGRALTRIGAVTLESNVITVPFP